MSVFVQPPPSASSEERYLPFTPEKSRNLHAKLWKLNCQTALDYGSSQLIQQLIHTTHSVLSSNFFFSSPSLFAKTLLITRNIQTTLLVVYKNYSIMNFIVSTKLHEQPSVFLHRKFPFYSFRLNRLNLSRFINEFFFIKCDCNMGKFTTMELFSHYSFHFIKEHQNLNLSMVLKEISHNTVLLHMPINLNHLWRDIF